MSDFIVPDPPFSNLMNPLDLLSSPQLPPPPPILPAPEQVQAENIAMRQQEQKLKSKKQTLKHLTFSAMREQGKGDNDIKAELKRIEQMCEDDLDFELQKIAWTQTEHFTDKVAQVLKDGAGYIADRMLSGEGHIKKEFEDDRALKDALHKELMGYMTHVGLKSQILLMSAGNIMHGKSKVGRPVQNNDSVTKDNNNNSTVSGQR
jgi:hypothetical protein